MIRELISAINAERYLKEGGISSILCSDGRTTEELCREADEQFKGGGHTIITFNYEGWSANITLGKKIIKFDTVDIYKNSANWANLQSKHNALVFLHQKSIQTDQFQLDDEETLLLKNGMTLHYKNEKNQCTLKKLCGPWGSYDQVRRAILQIHMTSTNDCR
ncbi:hypothetical protein [Paracidovorax oryzae]|uniref:hypothetical protein n=1 Tax=Paracidovorax oryzae TaxID=862720 RepID=UPI0012FED982|nr:hypothetical protein [Paracidovorax oryzae]